MRQSHCEGLGWVKLKMYQGSELVKKLVSIMKRLDFVVREVFLKLFSEKIVFGFG